MSTDQARLAVSQLKKVFDARGVFVRVDTLSEKADHNDPVTGKHIAVISQQIPQVVLIRANGKWGLSPETLRKANALYRETFPLDIEALTSPLPQWTKTPVLGVSVVQLLLLGLLILLGWVARVVVSGVIASQLRRVMHALKVTWGEDLSLIHI